MSTKCEHIDGWKAEDYDAVLDRLRTLVDEGISMQPVLGFDELLTLVERHMFEQRKRVSELEYSLLAIANGDGADEQAHDWPEFYASVKRQARTAVEPTHPIGTPSDSGNAQTGESK